MTCWLSDKWSLSFWLLVVNDVMNNILIDPQYSLSDCNLGVGNYPYGFDIYVTSVNYTSLIDSFRFTE